jgi:hypothetical protein
LVEVSLEVCGGDSKALPDFDYSELPGGNFAAQGFLGYADTAGGIADGDEAQGSAVFEEREKKKGPADVLARPSPTSTS